MALIFFTTDWFEGAQPLRDIANKFCYDLKYDKLYSVINKDITEVAEDRLSADQISAFDLVFSQLKINENIVEENTSAKTSDADHNNLAAGDQEDALNFDVNNMSAQELMEMLKLFSVMGLLDKDPFK